MASAARCGSPGTRQHKHRPLTVTFPLQPRADRHVLGAMLRCGALGLLLSSCTDFASTEIDATDAEALRYAQNGDLRAEVDSVVQPVVEPKKSHQGRTR
jgi:hypothetical protein